MENLMVIVSNSQPKREEQYPRTWLLYKGEETIEVHLAHDSQNRPLVLDKGVA